MILVGGLIPTETFKHFHQASNMKHAVASETNFKFSGKVPRIASMLSVNFTTHLEISTSLRSLHLLL